MDFRLLQLFILTPDCRCRRAELIEHGKNWKKNLFDGFLRKMHKTKDKKCFLRKQRKSNEANFENHERQKVSRQEIFSHMKLRLKGKLTRNQIVARCCSSWGLHLQRLLRIRLWNPKGCQLKILIEALLKRSQRPHTGMSYVLLINICETPKSSS